MKPMQTVRQQIIELLTEGEMDAREISQAAGIKEKEAIEHLSHVARTLAVQGKKLAIRPAECLLCGYVFEKRQRFTRPGRCPRCKKSHLQNPVFYISHRI
ncbi:MAG: transcriptional regulator [Desulfobacterales bacterium]